jgi:transposase-like protein
MTDGMMSLRTLLEKSSDADLRETVGFCRARNDGAMELEFVRLTGAAHRGRRADRSGHRSRFRGRVWETRAGAVELCIPKLRKSGYFPAFLEPHRMARKGANGGDPESLSARRTMRSVDDLVKAMGDGDGGEYIGFGRRPSGPPLGDLGPERIGDLAPIRRAILASSWRRLRR